VGVVARDFLDGVIDAVADDDDDDVDELERAESMSSSSISRWISD